VVAVAVAAEERAKATDRNPRMHAVLPPVRRLTAQVPELFAKHMAIV